MFAGPQHPTNVTTDEGCTQTHNQPFDHMSQGTFDEIDD